MEFITTTRGERQLLYDHYLYDKNITGASGNIYRECEERMRGDGCCRHTYPPNPKLTAVKKITTNMKKDARNATKCTVSANIAGGN